MSAPAAQDARGQRIAVLCHRLGPYHVARLNALAARCDLTVVELTADDPVYAWDRVRAGCAFRRVTLFDRLDTDPAQRRALPAALGRALDEARPGTVAAAGWGFSGALEALRWCLRRGVPAVLFSESQAADKGRFGPKEFLKGVVVRNFSAALVGGRRSAEYAGALGMDPRRIYPGYDVVDNDYFGRGADAARLEPDGARARLGLPPRYWLASCRFVPAKNLPALLRAYGRHRGGPGPAAPDLVVLGDGPQKAELLALRGALGLDASVHFPGFAQYPDLPLYYGLATAFVHASTVEAWGLVVNEAMAAGLAVLVSTACGCAPELVREGRNGFTFDAAQPGALERGLRALDERGDGALGAMGAEGRAMMRDWSPQLFAENMLKAAAAAAAAPRPRGGAGTRLLLRCLSRAL